MPSTMVLEDTTSLGLWACGCLGVSLGGVIVDLHVCDAWFFRMYFLLTQTVHPPPFFRKNPITFAHHLSCHTCILHHSCSQLAYHSRCSGRDGAETAGPSSRPPEWRSQNGNQARAPIWCSGPKTLTCPSARETSVMGKEVGGGSLLPVRVWQYQGLQRSQTCPLL